MKRDICFIGKAGSGKSTASEFIQGAGYTRASFATPLREVVVSLWGEEARNDRTKLIEVGMAMRAIDPDVWCNALIKTLGPQRIDYARRMRRHCVIDDCRFHNEYWALKAEGFVFVRVTADEDVRVRRLQANGKAITIEQMQSPSECELDDISADWTIANNGDYDTFIAAVAQVVGRINAN